MPSFGLTIGGRGDNYAGYVHFGGSRSAPRAYAALYYDGGRHHRHHRRLHRYGCGLDYYRGYRPIPYFGYRHYEPWYGYTYASVYTHVPYVYRYYDKDIYYVNQVVYDVAEPYGATGTTYAGALEGPPTSDTVYPSLTGPADDTPIGQGNAAFLEGRYDEARRLYAGAMMADERDGYVKFLYALANFALRDYDVAGVALRRSLLTTPDLIDYPVDVRSLYAEPGAFELQVGDLMLFAADHRNNTETSLLLGYMHYASGEPERALTVLDAVPASGTGDDVVSLLRNAVARVVTGDTTGD